MLASAGVEGLTVVNSNNPGMRVSIWRRAGMVGIIQAQLQAVVTQENAEVVDELITASRSSGACSRGFPK